MRKKVFWPRHIAVPTLPSHPLTSQFHTTTPLPFCSGKWHPSTFPSRTYLAIKSTWPPRSQRHTAPSTGSSAPCPDVSIFANASVMENACPRCSNRGTVIPTAAPAAESRGTDSAPSLPANRTAQKARAVNHIAFRAPAPATRRSPVRVPAIACRNAPHSPPPTAQNTGAVHTATFPPNTLRGPALQSPPPPSPPSSSTRRAFPAR